MTAGHKHRTVKVFPGAHPITGTVVRLLRTPLYHTSDIERVDRSRFVWGPCQPDKGQESACWYLSTLGILHALTGLTLEVHGDDDRAGRLR